MTHIWKYPNLTHDIESPLLWVRNIRYRKRVQQNCKNGAPMMSNFEFYEVLPTPNLYFKSKVCSLLLCWRLPKGTTLSEIGICIFYLYFHLFFDMGQQCIK